MKLQDIIKIHAENPEAVFITSHDYVRFFVIKEIVTEPRKPAYVIGYRVSKDSDRPVWTSTNTEKFPLNKIDAVYADNREDFGIHRDYARAMIAKRAEESRVREAAAKQAFEDLRDMMLDGFLEHGIKTRGVTRDRFNEVQITMSVENAQKLADLILTAAVVPEFLTYAASAKVGA